MNQYRFRKSSKIVSKLKLTDDVFYATIVDRSPTINIVLTKNQIDLEQFESFLEQIETLREYSPEKAQELSDSFFNYEQNTDLIATITGVVSEETIGELLLNSRFGDSEVPILHISWVGSSPYYSGNRFGVFIMYILAKYCLDTKHIQFITLDDDTDIRPINVNHSGRVDNIYYLIGFKHKGRIGISEYWKQWNPSNVVQGPERIIGINEFMSSREITQIQSMYKVF